MPAKLGFSEGLGGTPADTGASAGDTAKQALSAFISLSQKGFDSFDRRAQNFERQELKVSKATLSAIAQRLSQSAAWLSPYWTGTLARSHSSRLTGGDIPGSELPLGVVYLDHAIHPIVGESTQVYGPRYHENFPWFKKAIDQYAEPIITQYGAQLAEPYLAVFGGNIRSAIGGPSGAAFPTPQGGVIS